MNAPGEAQLLPTQWVGPTKFLNLIGLGLLAWGVSSQIVPVTGVTGRTVAIVLLVLASASWVVALVVRQDGSPASGAAIGAMALIGGSLAAFAPIAMVFPAAAVLSAAIRWRLQVAAMVAATGLMALVVTELALGPSFGVVLGCLAAILGGALIGLSRRLAVERAEQNARAEVEMARTEVERGRAELLAERNHLAREVHDVLAHTLAALSLQLEAFSTVVDADPATSPAIRDQLARTHLLVHEGLDEAHRAVSALRDDVTPLGEQLQSLAGSHAAEFVVSGQPEPLQAQVVLSLVRVTQEALTNVMKHATGAPASVHLSYAPGRVSVDIVNTCASGSPGLRGSGGGYGLRGIAERLALLGGTVEAGPTEGGWRVSADVPLAGPDPVRNGTADR